MTVYSFNLYIWINSTVLVMGRDLFIFAMLSPAELKRPSKGTALTGSIPEEDESGHHRHFIDCNVKLKKSHALG